jgi:hypothetical protein
MGYCGCMGYGMYFPANQLGGPKKLWGIREYGLSGLWVTRESTVFPLVQISRFNANICTCRSSSHTCGQGL